MNDWPYPTVGELRESGVIVSHKDGNHGANYPRAEEFGAVGIPFLSARLLGDWRIDLEGAPRLSLQKAQSLKFGFVEKGDVLLSHNATVGRVAIVPDIKGPAIIGTSLTQYRVDPERLSPEFLALYFLSPEFQNSLSFVMGQTTRNQVPITEQRRLRVRLPPIETQRAVVDLCMCLQRKIELNRKAAATLEEMARALYRSWFVDFDPVRARDDGRVPAHMDAETAALFPDSFGDDGLPIGWRRESLIVQAEWVNGAAYRNEHFSSDRDALPIVKIAELKAGITNGTRFTTTDLGARYRIQRGELLYSWSGNPDTSIDAFVWRFGSAWLNQHIFSVRENGSMSLAMLFSMLKHFNPHLVEIARNKQTTGLGHITKKDLESFLVVIPTAEVLAVFEGLLGPLFCKYCQVLYETESLGALRDTLLPRLMSGELRVGAARETIEDVV
jgi:type I restriction enzyme S subunit